MLPGCPALPRSRKDHSSAPTSRSPATSRSPRARPSPPGSTRSVLSRLERDGYLRRVIRGVHVATQAVDGLRLRCRALGLVVPRGAVVTDWTAVWIWTGLCRPGTTLRVPPVVHVPARGRGPAPPRDRQQRGARVPARGPDPGRGAHGDDAAPHRVGRRPADPPRRRHRRARRPAPARSRSRRASCSTAWSGSDASEASYSCGRWRRSPTRASESTRRVGAPAAVARPDEPAAARAAGAGLRRLGAGGVPPRPRRGGAAVRAPSTTVRSSTRPRRTATTTSPVGTGSPANVAGSSRRCGGRTSSGPRGTSRRSCTAASSARGDGSACLSFCARHAACIRADSTPSRPAFAPTRPQGTGEVAAATRPANSPASARVSGCHCTATRNRSPGASIASSVPSAAYAAAA